MSLTPHKFFAISCGGHENWLTRATPSNVMTRQQRTPVKMIARAVSLRFWSSNGLSFTPTASVDPYVGMS
jgi:hypothetical protein